MAQQPPAVAGEQPGIGRGAVGERQRGRARIRRRRSASAARIPSARGPKRSGRGVSPRRELEKTAPPPTLPPMRLGAAKGARAANAFAATRAVFARVQPGAGMTAQLLYQSRPAHPAQVLARPGLGYPRYVRRRVAAGGAQLLALVNRVVHQAQVPPPGRNTRPRAPKRLFSAATSPLAAQQQQKRYPKRAYPSPLPLARQPAFRSSSPRSQPATA